MTPKEINGLIWEIKDDLFNYSEFKERVFNVWLDLALSRILETNIDKIPQYIISECLKIDERKEGKVSLLQLREVLFKSKMITLTPF